jgi:glycyl-tRNA synthetase beta chain
MSELLLELFSGEIPAMMQQKAASAYREIFAKYFVSKGIKFDSLEVYVGPRRLALHVQNMPAKLDASEEEFKGPKVGAPEAAIQGFCRANNISPDQLSKKEINGAEFYVYLQQKPEQSTKEILRGSLNEPISEYIWPKSMYWGDYKIKWVRPLQNILCIFDGQAVPFCYGHLMANNRSYGNRFMTEGDFAVGSFDDYRQKLADNFVVLDSVDRKRYIQEEIARAAAKLGLVVKDDEALLEEVVGLAEYPQVLVGKIREEFLSVPSEILVSAMRSHQKYFSLFDKGGKFAPYFIFVSNIVSTDKEVVISGNEKVLSARLADALYFYHQDLKTSLQEKSKDLEKVIFHAKLGTLKEKTKRLAAIAEFITPSDNNAQQAALLCKSDIVSQVVDEFPTLQGIMGYYYAKAESLPDEVALAIRDHYKPQGPSDLCPSGASAVLALADKMDSLCGLMLAGEKPSGSKDPFALRRQSLGAVRIILENNLSINLSSLVEFCISRYAGKIKAEKDSSQQILSFLEERLRHFFKDQYEQSVISSVLDLASESNLLEIRGRLDAIKDFLNSKDGENLQTTYKRVSNILGKNSPSGKIDPAIFISDYEKSLFAAIQECGSKMEGLLLSKNYAGGLQLLASMLAPVSDFFEHVMVKDKDAAVAANRMLLLSEIKQNFNRIINLDE